MGQRHVCTFRHAQRAAYRTAISAAQILVFNVSTVLHVYNRLVILLVSIYRSHHSKYTRSSENEKNYHSFNVYFEKNYINLHHWFFFFWVFQYFNLNVIGCRKCEVCGSAVWITLLAKFLTTDYLGSLSARCNSPTSCDVIIVLLNLIFDFFLFLCGPPP